mmetsp:Transcript_29109/g.90730  ORF Transcript_29109/g.90730 Transcript_29109/m.90730 type:complete len:366 (+) Transcript_29109:36-1133(+)
MAVQRCRDPCGPAVLACLALLGTHAAQALRGARRIDPEQQPANRSYLFHYACGTADGLGGRVATVRPYVLKAMRNQLKFVCNPDDFDTKLHSTGRMGFLFGCNSESDVVGDLVSKDSVQNLTWEELPTKVMATPPNGTVFHTQECKFGTEKEKWAESYTWFRSQYHLVRKADKKRLAPECLDGTKKNIVLAIRKGDDPKRGFKAETYLDLLGLIFGGKIERTRINSTEARVVVISEAEEADRDMVTLRKSFQQSGLPAKFLLGKPEEALEASQARLVRDMDCMALSDVLVLSNSGFSDLGAVVQQTGVSLMLNDMWKRNVGLPNMEKVKEPSKYSREQLEMKFETSPAELPNMLYVDISLVSPDN